MAQLTEIESLDNTIPISIRVSVNGEYEQTLTAYANPDATKTEIMDAARDLVEERYDFDGEDEISWTVDY